MSLDVSALVQDPFVLAYLRRAHNRAEGGGQPQMHSPNQVIGEQRAFTIMVADQEARLRETGKTGRSLAEDLLVAVPFLWLNQIDELAAALPIPRHVIRSALFPYERCWWTFEGAHPMKPADGGPTVGWADGFLIVTTPTKYAVAVFGQSGSTLHVRQPDAVWGLLVSHAFRAGSVWPDDVPEQARPLVGRILAMQSFLDSPFVETSAQRAVGSAAKSRRSRPRPSPETVRFVRLRSPLLTESERRDGRSKDWHVRWIVRGHIRAQWYPSVKSHKLIWIAPYEKGPQGAPLKTPAYAVVR